MEKKSAEIIPFPQGKPGFLPSPRKHEWGPSRVGHGESQCIHCFITNREAWAIAPTYCLRNT